MISSLTMNSGHEIPQLGLGTYLIPDDEAERVVAGAIELGYRHIDTAAIYENEEGVGKGIALSGLSRDDLFVTTKLWNTEQGRTEPRDALQRSLDKLGLDRVDLYLIHWPSPMRDRYVDSWLALEELRDEGLAKSIGVSNFQPEHLDRLAAQSATIPAVNQVELHPYFQQGVLRDRHAEAGILTESWGPLGQGKYSLADIPEIQQIADETGATAAQVVLRWHIQEGLVVIPKSVSTDRLRENLAAGELELSADQMELMRSLERGQRLGPDPSEATF